MNRGASLPLRRPKWSAFLASCALTLGIASPPSGEDAGRAGQTAPARLAGVGILSKGDHGEQRMMLRDSWFQLPAVQAGLVLPKFFLAEPTDAAVRMAVAAEQARYGDIEVMVDVPGVCILRVSCAMQCTGTFCKRNFDCRQKTEAYGNVPHQTLAMLRYFSNNSSVLWIIKTDDDVFLRADAALRTLLATSQLFPKGARIYAGWLVIQSGASRIERSETITNKHPFLNAHTLTHLRPQIIDTRIYVSECIHTSTHTYTHIHTHTHTHTRTHTHTHIHMTQRHTRVHPRVCLYSQYRRAQSSRSKSHFTET